MKRSKIVAISAIGIMSMMMTGCSVLDTGSGSGGQDAITIGSKDFTENILLGHMFSQLLESKGIPTNQKFNLGGTSVVFSAMKGGQVDIYPEYTGTGLTEQLKLPTQSDPDTVYNTVKKDFKEKWNIDWLDPMAINTTWCLAVTKDLADKYDLKSISDLAKVSNEVDLASTQEFQARADGLPGLEKAYPGLQFKSTRAYAIGLSYQALQTGAAQSTVCFRTDGQISAFNLVALQDDQSFWPPYYVAPIVRDSVLKKYPEIKPALNELSKYLNEAVMRELNWKVDGNKEDPAKVAKDFLKAQKLI